MAGATNRAGSGRCVRRDGRLRVQLAIGDARHGAGRSDGGRRAGRGARCAGGAGNRERHERPIAGQDATAEEFAAALAEITRDAARLAPGGGRRSARDFSIEKCADRLLEVYDELVRTSSPRLAADAGPWDRLLGRLEIEWNLLVEKTSALAAAAVETEATRTELR